MKTKTICSGIGERTPRFDTEKIRVWPLSPSRRAIPTSRLRRGVFEGNSPTARGMGEADAIEIGLDMEPVDPIGVREDIARGRGVTQKDFAGGKILRGPVTTGNFQLPRGAFHGRNAEIEMVTRRPGKRFFSSIGHAIDDLERVSP